MSLLNMDVVRRLAIGLLALAAVSTCQAQQAASQGESADLAAAANARAAAAGVDDVRYEGMPQLIAGRLILPDLEAPTISTAEIGNGRTPEGFRGDEEAPPYPLPESGSQRAEVWNWSRCQWAAANTFSNPRYFEDRMLERHGHERWSKCVQPLASGARFFGTVGMLPYLMAVRNPCDCEYTLGYYRPGSCTPALYQRPPLERTAVLWQSGIVAGLIVAFP